MRSGRRLRAIVGLALALGACRVGDLLTTPQSPPDAPSGLTQRASNDTSAVAPGAPVHDSVVTLSALVADPDAADSLRLEVEVEPLGTAFGNSATHTSTVVGNGTVASVIVTGLVESGAYRWQARSLDPTGRTSAWTPFGGSATQPDFLVDAVPDPPDTVTGLAQLASDGVTPIPVGGSTVDTVIFRGVLSDPDPGDSLRLQVERQPVGTAFTGVPTATSTGVLSGQAASLKLTGDSVNVGYHWQARAIDATDSLSAWVKFGNNPEQQADYTIKQATPPDAPTSLGQYEHNNQAIAPGGTTTQFTVTFKATVSDPDGDQVLLQVEVQPLGTAFTGTATASSSLGTGGGQQQASVSVSSLVSGTDYHWQVRAVDQAGQNSAWVPFSTTGTPDFHVQ